MPPETDFRKRSRKRMAMGTTMELQEGHFWRLVSLKNQKMFQMEPKRNQKSEKRACKKCYKSRCRTKSKTESKSSQHDAILASKVIHKCLHLGVKVVLFLKRYFWSFPGPYVCRFGARNGAKSDSKRGCFECPAAVVSVFRGPQQTSNHVCFYCADPG